MSGGIEFTFYPIVIIAILSAITDLFRGRIYNWITFPAIIAGLVALSFLRGWQGLGDSLLGVVAGFALYGWMFWIRVMGGGDVKLLMALGSWGGLSYAIQVGIVGILVGGAMAALILIARGRILDFSRRIYRFFLTVLVRELALEAPKIDQKLTMPYGLPIAIAAIWVLHSNPLAKWGLWPW